MELKLVAEPGTPCGGNSVSMAVSRESHTFLGTVRSASVHHRIRVGTRWWKARQAGW